MDVVGERLTPKIYNEARSLNAKPLEVYFQPLVAGHANSIGDRKQYIRSRKATRTPMPTGWLQTCFSQR